MDDAWWGTPPPGVDHATLRTPRTINATGTVVPASLGRAPLSAAARAAVAAACGPVPTRTFPAPDTGPDPLDAVLAAAAGAPDGLAVTSPAAAVLLAVLALAEGRELVVSRVELLAAGGTDRLTQLLTRSHVRLREVGSTTRTRLADYRDGCTEQAGAVITLHRSGPGVPGTSQEATPAELAALASVHGLPYLDAGGPGLLRAEPTGVLAGQPAVDTALAAGAGLVIVAGDELLGGPPAGLIVGRAPLVTAVREHPLAAALQLDRLRRAALAATLRSYLVDPQAPDVPVRAMLRTDTAELRRRAQRLVEQLDDELTPADGVEVAAADLTATLGTGPRHDVRLPSAGLVVRSRSAQELADRLRSGEPSVVARTEQRAVVLDLRTVPPARDEQLVELLLAAVT